MKIIVKSLPEHWDKENDGRKPCTARELDGSDKIEIINTATNEVCERIITDVTVWKGKILISFKKAK
jgi:hypothetical protein